MLRLLIAATAITFALASSAFANPSTPSSSPSATAGAGAEANAGAAAIAGAKASNKTSVTTAQLNKQSLAANQEAAGGSSGGNSLTSEGDDIGGSWGFSYYDAEASLPQAVATDSVVVTSKRIKIGPVFGYSDQDISYMPRVVDAYAGQIMMAWGADPKNAAASDVATAYQATLCALVPQLVSNQKLSRIDCSD